MDETQFSAIPIVNGTGTAPGWRLCRQSTPLTFAQVIELWRMDASFRSMFIDHLTQFTNAYRLETPPVTLVSMNRVFEFVLVDSPELSSRADPTAFADHFRKAKAGTETIAFSNLSGDASLVVPCPVSAASNYAHLSAFMRGAPLTQKHSLWKTVGETVLARINTAPLWLNTAGAGVPWLHVRLDSRPKYYRHSPFRNLN